jgi:ribonuclease VapC
MVIDTSAIVAILFGEAEAEAFAETIEGTSIRLMSVASALEATIVIESELGAEGGRELDA